MTNQRLNWKILSFHLFLALFTPNQVQGQPLSAFFNRTHVDFGKIATVSYIPQTVTFTNRSDRPLAILLIQKSPDIRVRYERKFYEPGEQGTLFISCEPRNTGPFEETIHIYTNLSSESVPVLLKGTVVSVLECFPDPENMLNRSIEVIDSLTKMPVANAEIQLVHNHNFRKPLKVRVDRYGKAIQELPIGMYHITAEAQDYRELVTEMYIPRSLPVVVLELSPVRSFPEPAPVPVLEQPQIPNRELLPVITSSELPEDLYAANNLTFLLDISTSMKSGKKFLLLQQSVNHLALVLRGIDNVSVVTYSNEANILLTGAKGSDKEIILNAVQELKPYGITRGVKGLNAAFDLARQNYIPGGNNQIILMTDGEFSEKGISDSYYQEMLAAQATQGIYLSIVGFGVNNEAIDRMKLMCKAGQGNFILIGSDEFTSDVLLNEVKARSFIRK